MTSTRLSRRDFLIRTGWTVGGLTALSSCSLIPALPTFGVSELSDAITWVQMLEDGSVRFLCPRSEMGQGIDTGLSQVVGEELSLHISQIDCIYPASNQIAPTQMTVGSQSIENYFEPVARAAALIRETLKTHAARHYNQPLDKIALAERGFNLPDGRLVQFDQILKIVDVRIIDPSKDKDAAEKLKSVTLLSQREPSLRTSVGRHSSLQHIDSIVTGAEPFSRDIKFHNMKFGAALRPPWLGAKVKSYDEAAALSVAGVLKVVEGPDGQVGVVAETPMSAEKGIEALAGIWPELNKKKLEEIQTILDIDNAIAKNLLDHTPVSEGNLAEGRDEAVKSINVRYDTPMTAHAQMEPRSGVASVQDKKCEVWTGSQDPWFVRNSVSKTLGIDKENVVVHNQRVGGAFGGRILCQASLEAAWLSAAVKLPVKVQWTREEEFQFNYAGPQFSHRINASLNANNEICCWHHQMVGSPILISSAFMPDYLLWAADIPADAGTWRGTELPYNVKNHRIDFGDVRLPMPTGAWRGLGAAPNTFAVECTMDELAQTAEVDPIEFRLLNSSNERLNGVIKRVRELSGWAGQSNLGMAATAYKGVTFVAVVAEVAIENDTPKVERLWCVQDCGLVVSPDRVKAQIEGNLTWGVSMALHESFELENGIASTVNFDSYAICRQSDIPEMTIEIIDSELSSSGAGEAAFPPATAAIVNALSRAGGSRIRKLPLTKNA